MSDIDVINKYNDGMTCRKIGRELGICHATVSLILKRNNIQPKLFKRGIINKDKHSDIVQSYKNNFSTYDIAKLFKVSVGVIRKILIDNGIAAHPICGRTRKYKLDESFFDKVDTEQKAYFLGFLYADGYNNGKNGFVLNLQYRDKEILEKFKNILNYEGPLGEAKADTVNKQSVLFISSVKLSKQLTRLGCFKCKSLTLEFPTLDQVPTNLMSHFIRGYMDGDGSIGTYQNNQSEVSFVGSFDFIDSLQRFFESTLGVTGTKRTRNKIKELKIGGNLQSVKVLNWIYKDASISLERKRKKYLNIING